MTLYPPWTKPKEDCDLGLCYNNKIVWWWWFGGGGGLTRCCCVASLRAWPCCEPFRRLVSLSGANLHSSLLRERSAKCHSRAFRSESDFQSVCTAELHFFSFFWGAQLDVFCTTRAVIWHICKGFWGLATVLLSRSLALHLYIFYLFIYLLPSSALSAESSAPTPREREKRKRKWMVSVQFSCNKKHSVIPVSDERNGRDTGRWLATAVPWIFPVFACSTVLLF